MGEFQSGSGSAITGNSRATGSHCYRLMVHTVGPRQAGVRLAVLSLGVDSIGSGVARHGASLSATRGPTHTRPRRPRATRPRPWYSVGRSERGDLLAQVPSLRVALRLRGECRVQIRDRRAAAVRVERPRAHGLARRVRRTLPPVFATEGLGRSTKIIVLSIPFGATVHTNSATVTPWRLQRSSTNCVMGRVDAAPFCKRAQLGPVGSTWRRSSSIPMGA